MGDSCFSHWVQLSRVGPFSPTPRFFTCQRQHKQSNQGNEEPQGQVLQAAMATARCSHHFPVAGLVCFFFFFSFRDSVSLQVLYS